MDILNKIIETLIINGSLNKDPGLFYGKMGIAIFFFNYARLTKDNLFQEYAFDLLEKIQEQLTNNLSVQYDTGIAGIGSGFEYLLQNSFIEADNDFFVELDTRMCRLATHEPYLDLSLERGLTGCGRYFIYRLSGKHIMNKELYNSLNHIANTITLEIKRNSIPAKDRPDVFRFFCDLTTLPEYKKKYNKSLLLCKDWKCICNPNIRKIFLYMDNINRLYICQNYFDSNLNNKIRTQWKKWEKSDKETLIDTGLLKGWANKGMLFLTVLKKIDSSWINIL